MIAGSAAARSASSILAAFFATCATLNAAPAAAAERLALRSDTGDTSCLPGALQHAAALAAARENRLAEGLHVLDALVARCPTTATFAFDKIAVSSWAGQHTAAWDEGRVLASRADTPAYVVESVAVAARETGHLGEALALYDALLLREPDRVQAQMGRALTLLRQGHTEAARDALRSIIAREPGRSDVISLLAGTYRDAGDWTGLLATAQSILARTPDSPAAQRLRFDALRELGAARLAVLLTPADLLTADERASVERERIASDLRFARITADTEHGPTRWTETDTAVGEARGAADRLVAEERSAAARAQRYDLLVGLVDRRRMTDAIALYETLAATETPPPFVRLAAAAAYLSRRRPAKARELYESALSSDPRNLNARFGYFYALLESGHAAEAVQLIQALAADTPEWRDTAILELRRPNPDFPLVQARLGLALAYTNELSRSQAHLEALTGRAPANRDIRNSRNIVYQLRGWPRKAEADYQWMIAGDPEYSWAAVGLFDGAMAVRDYSDARQWLARARADMPDEDATRQRETAWAIHRLRELRVDAGMGRGYAGAPVSEPGSARDHVFDAVLFSSPFHDNWRVYGRANAATQRVGGESRERTAGGAGVEYRQRDWLGSAELIALSDGHDPAFSTRLVRAIGDHLSVSAEGETNTLAVPLRAYVQGIDARRATFDVTYRSHESASAGGGISRMNFSDGNRRTAWFAAATRKLVATPSYSLDARFDGYASRNTLTAPVAYFNPAEDRSLIVSLQNEWLHFREYERALRHRLTASGGAYWQAGFGSAAVYGVRYELAYDPGQRLTLNTGFGVTWRPFDGVRERLTNVFLTGTWRF